MSLSIFDVFPYMATEKAIGFDTDILREDAEDEEFWTDDADSDVDADLVFFFFVGRPVLSENFSFSVW